MVSNVMRIGNVIMTSLALAACLASCTEPDRFNVGSTQQFVVPACPFPVPSVVIDKDREMIIRSRMVVDDPCRTTWNAACPAARRARWTFGRLMTVMSGVTDETNPVARQFVGSWLSYWLSNQTVGLDPVPVAKRDNLKTALLNRWLQDSGCALGSDPAVCPLDLTAAPFRLLAIVNRIDMAGFDYTTGGTGPGELRFVFGAYNKATGAPVNAAVILEYHFPSTRSAMDWGSAFHALSGVALSDTPPTGTGTSPFADQLQAITDLVVEPNAQPGNPNNGSSIGQVRTNENAFDTKTGFNKTWEFRQFALPCASGLCKLAQVAVSQTPPTSANNTAPIASFLIDNQGAISTSHQVVPPSLLGGSSLSLAGNSAVLWNYPNPVSTSDLEWNATIRHNFGFGTCNGCHYLETANQNQQFHVAPRTATNPANLSPFLAISLDSTDGNLPLYYFDVADPDADATDNAGYPMMFHYNEPWRRACEIRRVLTGSTIAFTTATGHGSF